MRDSTRYASPIPSRGWDAETLTIRMAVPADAAAILRLAELDSAPQPDAVPTLLAEVEGELRAALPLDGRPPIANPFRHTAGLVAVLAARARELETPPHVPARRRWRAILALRPRSMPAPGA